MNAKKAMAATIGKHYILNEFGFLRKNKKHEKDLLSFNL